MTYKEATEYLFGATPVFEQVGGAAYKPGLDNIRALDEHYKHPHQAFKTIHVGGTNGKGSVSHAIAAVLQASGYRVGLFTSPHLVDFRERIRVNGEMVSEAFITAFTEEARAQVERLKPSFFELTTMMALCYFREQGVDVAVIEVGLGGRLDSTNIISPLCSVITNVSLDHTQYLGHTLEAIAGEKAGIIKPHTPIVLGQSREEVFGCIERYAEQVEASLYYAPRHSVTILESTIEGDRSIYKLSNGELIETPLSGPAQEENIMTILTALDVLSPSLPNITRESLAEGLKGLRQLTGLRGRYERLSYGGRRILMDTAHNPAGLKAVLRGVEADAERHKSHKHLVLSLSSDKDVDAMLALLPVEHPYLHYYFTQSSSQRSLPYDELFDKATALGLKGASHSELSEALKNAIKGLDVPERDEIVVLGSNFLVGDLLSYIQNNPAPAHCEG